MVKQIYLTDRLDPIRCCHAGFKWNMEQWHWRSTTHSPNLQDWSLTINGLVSYLGHSFSEVLTPSNDVLGVFYSPGRWGKRTLIREVLPLTVLPLTCRRCILQPQLTEPQDTHWRSLTPHRDVDGVFYSPSWRSHRTLIRGVLPLSRDVDGVFYSPSWRGRRTLIGEVLPLTEM